MDLRNYPEIVKRAYKKALSLLSSVNHYPYHNISHTLDVVGRAERIATLEWLPKEEITDLILASLFHDTGFVRLYNKNEIIGAEIAREWLQSEWYPEDRIKKVESIILATVLFSTPQTFTEKIMQDADLDNLWRDDCFKKTAAFRDELEKYAESHNDDKFYLFTEFLLHKFSFHTATSRRERQKKLEENAKNIRLHFKEAFKNLPEQRFE